MPNWETFTLQGSRGVTEMRVSLNARGVFTLNQLAFDELGNPEAVELLFDRAEKLVGLKAVDKNLKHAIKVRKQGKNKSYLIGAKAFCKYYKIDVSKTVRFEDITMENGVMVLDTEKTVDVSAKQTKQNDRNSLFTNA